MAKNKFTQQKPTAIFVDGSFFLKRYRKCVKDSSKHTPKEVAKKRYTILLRHVEDENLYRILYQVFKLSTWTLRRTCAGLYRGPGEGLSRPAGAPYKVQVAMNINEAPALYKQPDQSINIFTRSSIMNCAFWCNLCKKHI